MGIGNVYRACLNFKHVIVGRDTEIGVAGIVCVD